MLGAGLDGFSYRSLLMAQLQALEVDHLVVVVHYQPPGLSGVISSRDANCVGSSRRSGGAVRIDGKDRLVYDYDLLVIGSSPGGQKAAIAAAKLGKRV